VPAYTGVAIEVADVVALRERYGERIAGLKDSGGRLEHGEAILEAVPGLVLLSGSDGTVAAALRGGAHGVVSALANVVPEWLTDVRDAVAGGGDGAAEQARVSALRALTKAMPQRAALKALVAEVTGLPRSPVRPPQAELEPAEHAQLLDGFAAECRGVRERVVIHQEER
jgi:dihydrodipicolinate synthase/N-acetylneuraminate lyase